MGGVKLMLLCAALMTCTHAADLVIEIPGNSVAAGSSYRLDYSPPTGQPPPNTTYEAKEVGDVINFQGLPGTKYNFRLYYSNATFGDLLTWNHTIVTAPEPPTNLTVSVRGGKQATISWSPPAQGQFSGFRFKVLPLNEPGGAGSRSFTAEEGALQHTLRELYPGASYQIHAFTYYDDKESVAYTSRNFTTKPNTPGKFIVWFRNETTLLVLWQPPYPAGAYSHYKVSIQPPDARESELFVEKEGEPPGPAQAAFKGLIPGRAYNISVQTISEDEISTPTTAQYRTVPLRPLNVTVDRNSISSTAFKVLWDPPKDESEFDKYQVSIVGQRRLQPIVRSRNESTWWLFREFLEPGKKYSITVKTMSGKVTSWPASVEVTLKPLPVQNLKWQYQDDTGAVLVSWMPANGSTQDAYKVSYHEVEPSRDDSSTVTTDKTDITLDNLLPGRNYSITVQAVSNKMESNESMWYVATRPLAPVIKELRSLAHGFNISWRSDVNSKQDRYELTYRRPPAESFHKVVTQETWYEIKDLFPGAVYEIQVAAISHDRSSEKHSYFQAVLPLPPSNMSIARVSSNSVLVHWSSPDPAASVLSEFTIRYKTDSDDKWVRLPPIQPNHTEAEIIDMTHGERYTIQLDTASANVESGKPQQGNHTVKPNPVSNVASLVDSRNMTLEWPRPEGRVELYVLSWWSSEAPADTVRSHKNITAEPRPGARPLAQAFIHHLTPGTHYHFQIYTVSYSLSSDIFNMDTRTKPLIQSEISIVNDPNHTEGDTVKVLYTVTPTSASRFDRYRFALEGGDGEPAHIVEKTANDSVKQVVFSKLVPGKLYNITMWTVSANVTSHPVQRQMRLYPKPITLLNATHIGDRSITLAWDRPLGVFTDYDVTYILEENELVQRSTPDQSIIIPDLKPYRNYTFTVEVRAGTPPTLLMKSRGLSQFFQTREGVPGNVTDFHPLDSTPSEMTFTWSLPESEHNGVLTGFVITYGLQGAEHTQASSFPPNATQGTISSLIPGNTYVFKIHAQTATGAGNESIWIQNMAIAAPPKPRPQIFPTEVCRTSTTIQVRFRKNYFSSQNGNITVFTIIVAEDASKNASGLELPSWRDVQEYSVWPPYQVMEPYNPFVSTAVEDYTIGADSCGPRAPVYCNGPLKPGTKYHVKVRAFTAPDKFTDTAYSDVQTDADNTPIIVGVTVPLALLVLVVTVAVAVRRRRAAAGRRATDARRDSMSIPDSVAETSRPVRVSDFPDHYRIMSADSDFRFSEEFEELKHVGREQPCTAADLPCNRPKNRFTNILPYDHSRFKLQPVDDEEGSDYINANYVPGYNSPREFIVTQGPLHCTRDDFWRMCWESNSRAIVMLTRCVEKGREKCDHYWPYDTRPVYYGDISVTTLNDSHYPDWTVTEFMLCRGDQQRVLKHFHFTTWPDFGVPSPPTTLVRFVRAFRDRCPPDQRPIVVHCSAGVGRSGTFITLDRILQQLASHAEYVDIFGIVYNMRKERVWMVQTEQQYICIHQCLVAVLEGQELHPTNQLPPHQIHHNQAFEDDEGIAESGM